MPKIKSTNLRASIRAAALSCLIHPTEEFLDAVEEELARKITPELLETVRTTMVKAARKGDGKTPPQPSGSKTTSGAGATGAAGSSAAAAGPGSGPSPTQNES